MGHIVELAVTHPNSAPAINYVVETLRTLLGAPARAAHVTAYFVSDEAAPLAYVPTPRRGLAVWLGVLHNMQNETLSSELFGLLCELALKMRGALTQELLRMDRTELRNWLQEKLLGSKQGIILSDQFVHTNDLIDAIVASQESTIRFLYILAFGEDISTPLSSIKMDNNLPASEPFEFTLFDLLLDLLRIAFDTFYQHAKV